MIKNLSSIFPIRFKSKFNKSILSTMPKTFLKVQFMLSAYIELAMTTKNRGHISKQMTYFDFLTPHLKYEGPNTTKQ